MRKSYKLTQDQFEYIVEQADAILRKHASNISIVGIAWLHVLNSHPANQVKYVYVFNKKKSFKRCKDFFFRFTVIMADLLLSLFSFLKKSKYKNLSADIQVLFISHIVNPKATKKDHDFYFQELPDYLELRKYHTAIALMNHTKVFKGWEGSESDTPVKFLIPRRMGFLSELSLLARSLSTAFFFLKQSFSEKDQLKKSFLLELVGNVFSVDTMRAFRIYETVKWITENTTINIVALTWEGHSWERLVCHAAKTANRKILCIGYQHTILFPSSHALKRSFDDAYDPDIILTVGSVTKDIMESSLRSHHILVREYGSPRMAVRKLYQPDKPLQNACLIAPEGLVEESIRLFSFGIEMAKLMPETNFVFRTYPALDFEDLQVLDERLQNLPTNIIISSFKKIEDDFNRTNWLLYRSSSVSFFATLSGLRPVYLQMEDELSIDPLYALQSWRLQVTKPDDMVSIINKDKQTSLADKKLERQDAIIFCETYMTPYNMPVFEQCLPVQN